MGDGLNGIVPCDRLFNCETRFQGKPSIKRIDLFNLTFGQFPEITLIQHEFRDVFHPALKGWVVKTHGVHENSHP